MGSDEQELCLTCSHPKAEHVASGCNHTTYLGDHLNESRIPERRMCDCQGFFPSKKLPAAGSH